jgi:hypothetical protein
MLRRFILTLMALLLTGCNGVSIDYLLARAHVLTPRTEVQMPVPGLTLTPYPTKLVNMATPTSAVNGVGIVSTEEISEQQTPTVAMDVDQAPTSGATMVLSQNVNGIEITVHNIRRGDNMLKADICFPVLDSEDWMLNQLALQCNGKEIRDWGGSLIDPIIPAMNGQPGKRCDMVYFSVSDQEQISDFTISVLSIYAPPREGGMCERIDSIQKQLDKQESGLKINCQEGNEMAGYQIVAKPDTMSEGEARIVIMDVINRTIQGPWEFFVRLK